MQLDVLLDPFGARWAEVRDAASCRDRRRLRGHLDLGPSRRARVRRAVRPRVLDGVERARGGRPGRHARPARVERDESPSRCARDDGGDAAGGLGRAPDARARRRRRGHALRARAGGGRAAGRSGPAAPGRRSRPCIEEVRRLWQQSRVPGARSRAAVRDRCPAVRRWPSSPGGSAMGSTRAQRTRACSELVELARGRARALGPRSGAVPGHGPHRVRRAVACRRLTRARRSRRDRPGPPHPRPCRRPTTGAASPKRAACSTG